MSITKVGQVAPFPPLSGQPYPPARNHPRWKELYRLHDEWLMEHWPFSSEQKRARIPFMNLGGFSTWCSPGADFDRMVWGALFSGIFFLADDLVDSGKMLDRIPGFKKAATCEGPLHKGDRAEICHDIVFRAIRSTCHPRTFKQIIAAVHEWWDSNLHEPFQNLDQYLAMRRVNIGMYLGNAGARYTLNINLTDEQVNHPLMREAEGVISDHLGLVNDYFSYLKEKLTNSDDTNIIRILMDHQKLTYEEAMVLIEQKIQQKEQDFITAGLAVINDPVLGSDPEVHRWIASLPYCMGGNIAWSQETARYNVGTIDGEVAFPTLSFNLEETPEDEVVDDTEESAKRDAIINVSVIPAPDFAIDNDPAVGSIDSSGQTHRAENVGIIGIEVYCPPDTRHPGFETGVDINSIALSTVLSLLDKYEIHTHDIGRVDIATEMMLDHAQSVRTALMELFDNVHGTESFNDTYGSTSAFFNAINWVESKSWDSRYAVIFASTINNHDVRAVAMLIGEDAALVPEFIRAHVIPKTISIDLGVSPLNSSFLTALERTFLAYRRNANDRSGNDPAANGLPLCGFSLRDLDHVVVHTFGNNTAQQAHALLMTLDTTVQTHPRTFQSQTEPTLLVARNLGSIISSAALYENLASLISCLPSYALFDKRIAMFAYGVNNSSFYTIKVMGDTSRMRSALDLARRLNGPKPGEMDGHLELHD